ncbi:MAG: signal peptidase I, partial [Acidimicrobiales bacterium]
PFYIPSPSMTPQLMVNDKILVSRISYRLHGVHRGDLVVFNAPPNIPMPKSTHHSGPVSWVTERLGLAPRNDVLVKRVIGLPGDTVESRDDGHVYVNGRLLLEPYLRPGTTTVGLQPQTVGPHQLLVLGDNRGDSEDSRVFGPIRRSSIIGRAVVRVWPLDKVAFL